VLVYSAISNRTNNPNTDLKFCQAQICEIANVLAVKQNMVFCFSTFIYTLPVLITWGKQAAKYFPGLRPAVSIRQPFAGPE
jgi:hypothetical protein